MNQGKEDEITDEMRKDLHPQVLDQLVFWQDRAKNAEIFERLEDLWALQYRWKYQALRKVGFGRIMAFIFVLRVIK